MSKLPALLTLLTVPVLLGLPWAADIAAGAAPGPASPTPAATEPSEEQSWIWLDLPPDATQLDHGKEVYRLVCSSCHAYDGTGLTDEWRATWNPQDQDCWQSKCHGFNHPSDGFFLPHSPPVVGPVIPAMFETAYDLYSYDHGEMPWHNPHSLTTKEAWAVTAYLLYLNGIDPGSHLDAETAAQIRLRPEAETTQARSTEAPTPTAAPTAAPIEDPTAGSEAALPWRRVGTGMTALVVAALAGYLAIRRRLL